MADPWAEFRTAAPVAAPDPWASFRAAAQQELEKRKLEAMTPDELRAAGYVQPPPPKGVTIHTRGAPYDGLRTQSNPVFIDSKGKPQQSTMAEAEARMMRERDGIAGDVGDSVLRGVPYAGAFFPRARAAADALPQINNPITGNRILGGGGDYGQNLEREQARAKTFDEDYPAASIGGKVTGGVLGTVAAAPVPYLRGAFGLGGGSALGSMAYGGAAGLAQGAAQGIGESADLTNGKDVANNAAWGGAVGGALGAAIPGAIAGGVNAKDYFASKLNPDTLSQVPSAARRYLMGQFDDPAKVAQMQGEMQRLGPGAMLADASPEMQGIAGGAATRPGTREIVVNPLNQRNAGKNARIQSALDNELGPVTPPNAIREGIEQGQEALGPLYGNAFSGAAPVNMAGLANRLDNEVILRRGPAQQAARSVRGMLNATGSDQLDTNARTLFETRNAIDGMLRTEVDGKAIAQLTAARRQVDEELTRAVPNIKDVDAQFQELARQDQALTRGSQVLDTGKTAVRPGELVQEMADNANPAGNLVGPSAANVRLREGARAEIDRIVGTEANDVAKLNQFLKSEGDWNRDKLRVLFGQDRADRLLNVLDRERAFEATWRQTTGNSETASRQGFGKLLDSIASPPKADTSTSFLGLATALAKKGVEKVRGGQGEEQAQRVAEALARLSVADGPQASALVQALMTRTQRVANNRPLFNAAGGYGPQMSPLIEAIADDLYRSDRRSKQK